MSFQDLIVNARAALQDDQLVRIVIAAAVGIFLLVLTVAVVFITRTLSPAGRLESLLEERASTTPTSPWVMRIVLVLLVLVAVLGSGRYLESPSTCGQCHVKSQEAATLESTPHRDVACGKCHGGAGPTGSMKLAVSYTRWTYLWVTGGQMPKKMRAAVDPLTCMSCHSDIGPTRTVAGIRVRHKDFLDAGIRCDSCHSAVSHPGVVEEATKPTMNECLPCHDGKTASSECSSCHQKDLALEAATKRPPARIQVSTPDCYSCHSEKPCLRCHGISMPHPKGWSPNSGAASGMAGSHARQAFLYLERCWRCHSVKGRPGTADAKACACHSLQPTGGMHGGKVWVQEHGLEATGKKEGALAECFICHTPTLCNNCHPASYAKMYNPRTGYDHYQREFPPVPGFSDF